MTDKPTRIVAPPFLRRATNPGGGHTQPMTCVTCDDGRTYPLHELAALLGISKKALRYRIDAMGWDDPRISFSSRLITTATVKVRAEPGDRRRRSVPRPKTTGKLQEAKQAGVIEVQPIDPNAPAPTRIIAPPFKRLAHDSFGRPRRIQVVRCDNGQVYTLRELGMAIGIDQTTLRCRISQNGWDHPNILGPQVPKGLDLNGVRKNTNAEGSAEWQGMSPRPRSSRLATIPSAGRYEMSIGG